jgi:hypothetical protein
VIVFLGEYFLFVLPEGFGGVGACNCRFVPLTAVGKLNVGVDPCCVVLGTEGEEFQFEGRAGYRGGEGLRCLWL